MRPELAPSSKAQQYILGATRVVNRVVGAEEKEQVRLQHRTAWMEGYNAGKTQRIQTHSSRPVVYAAPVLSSSSPVSMQMAHKSGWEKGVKVEELLKDLDANPNLEPAQREQLIDMLLSNKVVFEKVRIDPKQPRAKDVEFVINTGDAAPIKQQPYRHPPLKEAIVHEQVKELQDAGLVEPSFSPWGSPVLLVKKKDGSQRMCIDYRKLNSVTKKDAYPLPLIEDCLDRLKDADWMTILDLADAYHHIPMHKDSEAATAFVTKDGLYHWKVMPFGATGAPGAFQRYVDRVLTGLIGTICTAYFDDIVIYTKGSYSQHLQDVETVLKRLAQHNLRAKLKKCHFAQTEILFVGHQVTKGTVMPDPEKVKAITEIPEPTDVTSVKSFLGLANYYRKFIKNFAQKASPLYRLTKKDVPFNFDEPCRHAFQDLKRSLVDAPCLYAPDFKKPFILQTDACDAGIACVLTQNFDGTELTQVVNSVLPNEIIRQRNRKHSPLSGESSNMTIILLIDHSQ